MMYVSESKRLGQSLTKLEFRLPESTMIPFPLPY